jgi:hypothetical protein
VENYTIEIKFLKNILKIYLFNLISYGQLENPLLKWDRTSWLSSQLLLECKQIWCRESRWDHWHLKVDYLSLHRKRGKEWWIEIEANNERSFYSYFLQKTTLHIVLSYLFLRNVYTHKKTVTLITWLLNIECFLLVSLLVCSTCA